MDRLTDLLPLVCSPKDPIRLVLERLNAATPYLFQLVVDDNRRLLGSITDGDIRRAMLRGVDLQGVAGDCMNRSPIVGRANGGEDNVAQLRRVGLLSPFLPLVDADKRLTAVLFEHAHRTAARHALIMAGGLGSRLGARTKDTPKPLLPVAGKPILEHILLQLEKAGVERIYIAVHHMADQVVRYVEMRENRARVETLHETSPLGTAGAIGLISPAPESSLIVLNGDLITDIDFGGFSAFHEGAGFDATVAVSRHTIDIPFGVIQQDANGLFLGIEEKPQIHQFVAAGIYYLSPKVMALASPLGRLDMPTLLARARSADMRVALFPIHEYWIDVGRPADLESADRRQAPDA